MGIGMRIGVGFLVVLALMAGMLVAGLWNIHEANSRLRDIVGNKNVKVEAASAMLQALRERALAMHAVSVLEDPFAVDDELQRFMAYGSVFRAARERLEALPLTEAETTILEDVRRLTREAQPAVEEVVRLAQEREGSLYLEKMREDAMPRQRLIADRVEGLIALQRDQAARDVAEADQSYHRVRELMGVLGLLALLLGLTIAVVVSRRVAVQARELEQRAHYDELTQLPNRTLLQEQLAREISRSRRAGTPFAVLLMDLDGFKAVNDTLGHEAGDHLLREVARRLHEAVRSEDVVARLGGDEFVVVLHDVHADRVVVVAQKIMGCLDQPVQLDGQSVDIGVSGGLAVFPWHGEDTSTLLRQADIAMYVAKRGGKRLALYSPEQELLSSSDLSLKSELREAIDNGQLELHYQPKIDVASERVIGFEALVRWNHPQRGFLTPDRFIPLAEQAGIITPLTHWVLRTALAQVARLAVEGHALGVAVNLSAKDLHDTTLPRSIEAMLEELSVPAERLTLELTESAVMASPSDALKIFTELDRMGVALSIDDFGTGYSSLAHLKRLPVDEIKIDRSFVMDMLDNDNDAVIVKSTLDLGHNLGLRVVAEGVENAQTLSVLGEMGCNAAQGYYMSKPLPAEKLPEWLEKSRWASGIAGVVSARPGRVRAAAG